MKRFFLTLPLAAILAAAAVGQPPARLNPDTATLAQDSNAFALELYRELAQKDGNLFFSPYSISNALAMTYAGARGKTAQQMEKTLHFSLGQQRLHPAFGELVRHLNQGGKQGKYQLTVANRLWGQKDYGFLPDFTQLIKGHYGAGLQELDFEKATEQARKTINAWVEQQTKDKIKNLIPEGALVPDTRLVLTNAIYFKAAWAEPFIQGGTKKEDFHVSTSKKVQAPMMHRADLLRYFDGGDFKALELPYENRELSMIVLLPKKIDGLPALEKQLTIDRVAGWLKQLKVHQVKVALPKFKFTSEFKLNKALADMGMPLAFSKMADFSGMASREKLFIDAVLHKAFVDVHEKGTEAAAATAVIIRPTSAPGGEPAEFRADRPFVFLIRENRTGSILFVGRVSNPV